MASKHRPNFVLGMLSELVACFSLPRPERFRMDANITFFHDCHGKCERILKTPIPLSYTRSGSLLFVWSMAVLRETKPWASDLQRKLVCKGRLAVSA